MKRFSTLLVLIIFLAACSSNGDSTPEIPVVPGCTDPGAANYNAEANEDDCNCTYDGFVGMATPPAVALKNVLLEEFKGEWCGWSTDGEEIIENLKSEFSDRFYVTRIHSSDFLTNEASQELNTFFWNAGCPTALIDRITGVAETRDLWESKTRAAFTHEAQAQIAIETKLEGQVLEGIVYMDFNGELPKTDYRLHLYLTEGGLEAESQLNYLSGNPEYQGSPYYDLGGILSGQDFIHNNVLKKIVIKAHKIGEKAITDDGVYTRKFRVLLHDYHNPNVDVLAFITNSANLSILNVKGVKAGETASW